MADPIRTALLLPGARRLWQGGGGATPPAGDPLMPVHGRPLIDLQLRWLARNGIDRIGVVAEAGDGRLARHLREGFWRDPHGGAPEARLIGPDAIAEAGAEPVLLVDADGLYAADLAPMLAAAGDVDAAEVVLWRFADPAADGTIALAGSAAVAAAVRSGPPPTRRSTSAGGAVAFPGNGRNDPALLALIRRPAVFFDRDGVLNVDHGYVHRIADFAWMPEAAAAIRAVRAAGFLVVVVSNQSGVAHGMYGEEAVHHFHRHMSAALRAEGAAVDAFYFCPYHAEGSVPAYARLHEDRKPAPGMLLKAARDLDLDMGRSFLVGDRDSDLVAAARAGIPGHLYRGGSLAEFVAPLVAPG